MPDIKFVDEKGYRDAKKAGNVDNLALRKGFSVQTKGIDEAARTIDFVISTATVDRMGDTVNVEGWELDNYRRNPVVLWCHDCSQPPVARAVKVSAGVGALQSTAEFVPADLPAIGPFAECVFQLYLKGFLSAVSVGFMPIEAEWSNEDDRPYGLDFIRQELLEYSCCPVPANPEALIQARAAGIDTAPVYEWAERVLDGGDCLILPRRLIEEARKAATDRTVNKAGRVLSATNEEKLRTAHAEIGAVLSQLEPEAPADDGTDKELPPATSRARRFPRRTAREIELHRLRTP